MKKIWVIAVHAGKPVPSPHGKITDKRAIEVPHDTYIRNRLKEGDLLKTSAPEKNPAAKTEESSPPEEKTAAEEGGKPHKKSKRRT